MLDYDNLTWKERTLIETMLIKLFACEETFLATITFDRWTLVFLFRRDAWINTIRSDRFRGKFYEDTDRSFSITIVTSRARWFTFRGGYGIVIFVLRNCKEKQVSHVRSNLKFTISFDRSWIRLFTTWHGLVVLLEKGYYNRLGRQDECVSLF
jgi:hypothetical protein